MLAGNRGVRHQSYDLRAAEAAEYSDTEWGRRATIGIMAFLLVIGAGVLYVAIPLYVRNIGRILASTESTLMGLIGLLAALAVVAVVVWILAASYRHKGRGPTVLEVDPGGFRIRWEDGGSLDWRWDSIWLSVNIRDYGASGFDGIGADLLLRSLVRWAGLTQEGLAAILESAKGAGLRIRTYDQSSFGVPLKLTLIDTFRAA